MLVKAKGEFSAKIIVKGPSEGQRRRTGISAAILSLITTLGMLSAESSRKTGKTGRSDRGAVQFQEGE